MTIDRVVVIEDFSDARGGAAILAGLGARLMRKAGLDVTFICGDAGDSPSLLSAGIDVVALGGTELVQSGRLKALGAGVHNSSASRLMEHWIERNDTARTIYHVHGWSKILSPALFAGMARVRHRTLVHAHDFFMACPNGAFYDYRRNEVCTRRPLGPGCLSTACDRRNYGHKLWRSARGANLFRILGGDRGGFRLVLPHDRMAPFLELGGYAPKRMITIRNPVTPFSDERVRAEDNAGYLFVGRLDSGKGLADAVEATRRAGARLCVVGEGPLKGVLSGSSHVEFLGWQPHEEIGRLARGARALLMPSRYPEPFGLVALEASRSGLPVVISRKAFIADEMSDAGVAIAVDTDDGTRFAAALASFDAMAASEIRSMSLNGFQREDGLATSPDEWGDCLLTEYRRLLNDA